MDVTDALRRIVMRHLVLIAVATLVSILGFAAYKASKPATYTASVQLEVDDKTATSTQGATAAQDGAIAITKSTDVIRDALTTAGVVHDPIDFQQNDLTVTPVLTAPVIQIDVTYTDKQNAVNIADQLAKLTSKHFYDQNTAGPLADKKNAQAEIDQIAPQYDAAVTKIPTVVTGTNAYYLQAQGYQTQMADLRKQIAGDDQKINEAFTPKISQGSQIVPQTTLAKYQPYVLVLVLGLILGVGSAAVIESVAPTVVGAAGLAGLFAAPHLGHAIGRGGKVKGRITDLALAARLHAAARRVGADTVVIAGDVRCDLPDLAGRLDALLGGAANQPIGGGVPGQKPEGSGAPDPKALNAGESSKELATRQSSAPAVFSERLSFGEDIPSVWVHPRVLPYDEQVLLLLSTAPVSVAVAVVGAPKGKRRNLTPAIELVETSGWEILGTIVADPARKSGTV